MRKFRVLIEGRNFLVAGEGGAGAKHGFYTNRFGEAVDATAAEAAAIVQLRSRPSLRDAVRNARDDPPMMYVAEVEELASFEGLPSLDPGLAWFLEEPTDPADAD